MDHAEAHERIADLVLEPQGLESMGRSAAPEDRALREHLDRCEVCRADLDTWRQLQHALSHGLAPSAASADGVAVAGVDDVDVEPLVPPEELRSSILRVPQREPRNVSSGSEGPSFAPEDAASTPERATTAPVRMRSRVRSLGLPRVLAIAAALVIVVVGSGLAVTQGLRISNATKEEHALTTLVAAVDRVLAEPEHEVVALTSTAGTPAGSVSWSRRDLVVLTRALSEPGSGQIYRCWIEWAGREASIGSMEFADGSAYWVGSLGDWAAITLDPGTRFLVTLEPAGSPGQRHSGEIVLQANLGS